MDKSLSIIIPSYNMEQYLPKCCDSLLIDDKELFDKLDVIIVNDGSTDRTSEIAHSYEAKYPGVFRVIDKPNGHYGSCINAALPEVRGAFVKILDADDSFDTSNFKKYLGFLSSEIVGKKYESVDCILTDYVRVDNSDSVLSMHIQKLPVFEPFDIERLNIGAVRNLWMQSVTYRTEIFKRFEYHQSEGLPFTDQQWLFLPMGHVNKAVYCPCLVYRYLCGRDGQTVNPEFYKKNFGVIVEITEKQIDDYLAMQRSDKDIAGICYLKSRLYGRVENIYRYCLLVNHGAFWEKPLSVFDDKVAMLLPEFYGALEDVRYLRRIPVCWIRLWHHKRRGHPFGYWMFRRILVPIAEFRTMILSKLKVSALWLT